MVRQDQNAKLSVSSSSSSSSSHHQFKACGTDNINTQRYTYVMACLVGHTVTANMKDQKQIRGIFHSGSISSAGPESTTDASDLSVVLKCARELPVDDKLSGEILDTIIIQGKDMISLLAENCPTTFEEAGQQINRKSGFKTDVEISGNLAIGEERELEKWEPEIRDSNALALGSLEDRHTEWDQFEVNARRFQVKSTYQEEFYTTPLDVTAIPQEVREKADKIAREIEESQFGTLDPEKLGEGDLDDEEEARFGAVRGTGAYRYPSNRRSGAPRQPKTVSATATPFHQPTAASPTQKRIPATPSATTRKLDNLVSLHGKRVADLPPVTARQLASSIAYRGATGLHVAQKLARTGLAARACASSARNSTLAKNISALNLEPAIQKADDPNRIDLLLAKPGIANRNPQSRPSGAVTPIDRTLDKQEFLSSLHAINKKMETIEWGKGSVKSTVAAALRESASAKKASRASGTSGASSKNFRFNPNADAFTPKTSFHCTECDASELSKCPHRPADETSKDRFDGVPVFKLLTTTPRRRMRIDTLLSNEVLPRIETEAPSAVGPEWTGLSYSPADLPPFTYNQILGDLQPSASVTAAVHAAVGTVYHDRKQLRSIRPFLNPRSGQHEYRSNRQMRGNQSRSSRPSQSPATQVSGASHSTQSQSNSGNRTSISSRRGGRSGPGSGGHGNVPGRGAGCDGEGQGEEGFSATPGPSGSSTDVSSTPTQQQQQQQPPLLMMAPPPPASAAPPNTWRMVRQQQQSASPLIDFNATTPTVYPDGVQQGQQTSGASPTPSFPPRSPAVGSYPPQEHTTQTNSNFIVLSRNVVSHQTGVMAVMSEDGTMQHVAAMHPQAIQGSHPHHNHPLMVAVDPGMSQFAATNCVVNNNDQQSSIMPSPPFPSHSGHPHFMGVPPGSGLFFIPSGSTFVPAQHLGTQTSLKLENGQPSDHSTSRWIPTVDGNPSAAMLTGPPSESQRLSASNSAVQQAMVNGVPPQPHCYPVYAQHSTGLPPDQQHTQFIGFQPGYFPANTPYGQIRAVPSLAPQSQPISFSASHVNSPLMMVKHETQQPQLHANCVAPHIQHNNSSKSLDNKHNRRAEQANPCDTQA